MGDNPDGGVRVRSTSALDRNRTCDLRYRKPALYPLSYEGDAGGPAAVENTSLGSDEPTRGARIRCGPHAASAALTVRLLLGLVNLARS